MLMSGPSHSATSATLEEKKVSAECTQHPSLCNFVLTAAFAALDSLSQHSSHNRSLTPGTGCSGLRPRQDDTTAHDWKSVHFLGAWWPWRLGYRHGADRAMRHRKTPWGCVSWQWPLGLLRCSGGWWWHSDQLDALFLSEKEIETPLGMDDTKQNWKWADVGSRRMPRSPLTCPTVMVGDENGIRRPAVSQVHHRTLFQ